MENIRILYSSWCSDKGHDKVWGYFTIAGSDPVWNKPVFVFWGARGKAFYFMDPPYRDSFTQYGQTFGDQQHKNLIDFCKEKDLEGNLVFYCNRDAGDDFYDVNRDQLAIQKYAIKYTAGRRATNDDGSKSAKDATEILLHSKSISAPVDKLFAYI